MKENGLNTIIKNSFDYYGGRAHKISDGLGGIGVKNPFDGLAVFRGKIIFWEAKFIRGLKAFNFKKIEEHQIDNLTIFNNGVENSWCIIPVGFYAPREFFYVVFFNIETINLWIQSGIVSVKKKQLQKYIDDGKYLNIEYVYIEEKKKQIISGLYRLDEVLI